MCVANPSRQTSNLKREILAGEVLSDIQTGPTLRQHILVNGISSQTRTAQENNKNSNSNNKNNILHSTHSSLWAAFKGLIDSTRCKYYYGNKVHASLCLDGKQHQQEHSKHTHKHGRTGQVTSGCGKTKIVTGGQRNAGNIQAAFPVGFCTHTRVNLLNTSE